MLDFIALFPAWLSMLIGILAFVAAALAIAVGIYRIQSPDWQHAFKGMIPPLCASLMVAYAIFAVIVANTSWRDQEDAQRTARAESYALKRLLYHMPAEGQGRQVLKTYIESVIRDEWPRMAHGRGHPDTTRALVALQRWSMAPDVPYATGSTTKFFEDAIRDLGATREHRLTLTRQSIPDLLWAALLICAFVVLLAVAMAHAQNKRASLIMCGLYGAVMGTILMTMVLLDRPYSGSVSVSTAHIEDVLNRF